MKKSVITLVAIAFAMFDAAALAQNAPLRDFGLLALNSDDSHSGLGNSSRSTLVETPDSGGGSIGARALRGADGNAASAASRPTDAMAPDALPSRAIVPFDDPSQPAAPTPKRPSYRWQSLVPGAIK